MNLDLTLLYDFSTATIVVTRPFPGAVLIWFAVAALSVLSTAGAAEQRAAASTGLLLVANKGNHTLAIIDPAKNQQIASVDEEGVTGHEVAASSDGKLAFVPIYGNSGVGHPGTDGSLVRVIDLVTRKIVGTVDLGKGVRPHCAVVGRRDGMVYITTELDNSLTVVDPRSLKVLHSIPTGQPESHMLAISSDGKRGYTANVGPGTISVLDLQGKKLVATISVAPQIQRISISRDDRFVFTSDQTKPQLAVIDTGSNTVKDWLPLPGIGYGTAVTPDGHWLVVALINVNKVAVVSIDSMRVERTFDVPRAPQEVLVRPDGRFAYVSCDASRKVAVLDLGALKVDTLIDAGPGADGLAWANAK